MVDRKFGNSNHVLPIGQTTHIKYEAKDEAGKDLYQVQEKLKNIYVSFQLFGQTGLFLAVYTENVCNFATVSCF